MLHRLITNSPEETKRIGCQLAERLSPGDIILLMGDIGTGKTTFTQGLAEGLGITDSVNSPTFTLVKEYQGRLPLYHMDLYRLERYEDLGFDEYFYGDGITVVEWPEVLGEETPQENLTIRFSVEERGHILQFQPKGDHYVDLIKEFMHDYSRN